MKGIGIHRLWPRSLYGQLLMVTASALLLAQGVNAALLLSSTRSRAVAEATTMVVTRVANQIERQQERGITEISEQRLLLEGPRRRRGAPVAIETAARPLVIDRFQNETELTGRANEFLSASNLGLAEISVASGSMKLLPAELRTPLARRFMRSKMWQAGQVQPRLAVLLTARTADGRWLNAAAFVRPTERGSIFALIVQTLLLYIAVLVPLALIARRIARPLNQLTGQVRRVGLTGPVEPLQSQGPDDVRQLIEAFNAMHARVSALLGEKDVMLGAIGHDLKTPLSALRVRVESVEDDSERQKMSATIDEMVSILDDILMLARLGRSGEAVQNVDLGALVESVVDEFPAASMVETGGRVVAPVRPVLLRRAIRNLIDNAVAYGKEATVEVKAAVGSIQIDICDRGPGIPPAQIEALFEPFARADISRNRATGGSGLGLTIARAIARSHGGDVSLENRAEGGLRATLAIARQNG
jgi:signal transduction histidine kinase